MDIQSIRKIIFPAVSGVVSKLEEENHNVKITFLREIFNDAINGALNISHTNNTSIKAMFSGRGRAWASTRVSNDNPVWVNIRSTLTHEILYSDPSSDNYKECTNLLDAFEEANFAWMRFGSVSKNTLRFHLRTKGSKLEHHISLYTDSAYIFTNDILNLEGVPHRLGLESGIFKEEKFIKEVIEKPVDKKELNSIGIKTLEDILS
jgi:hypothetical protein